MTRDNLTVLIAGVEGATAPDGVLDAEIHRAANVALQDMIASDIGGWLVGGNHPQPIKVTAYTASLDAAMAEALRYGLVNVGSIAADGMPGCCIVTCTDPVTEVWGLSAGGTDDLGRLARATIAAALRARLAQMGDGA
jgi:hypothetical protein